MSKVRAESKLFRGGSGAGKPGRKPAPAMAPAAVMPSKESLESSNGGVDPDLTRALKQIFEVRNCKLKDHSPNGNSTGSGSKNSSEESCVTLFGRRLGSPASSTDGSDAAAKNGAVPFSRQGTDKLPPAATAHLLQELHKQRLKQRGITATANDFPDMGEIEFVHTEKRPEVSTLQLLNNLQEKRPLEQAIDCGSEAKRPRIEKEKTLDLSLSMKFGSPEEVFGDSNTNTSTEGMEIAVEEERSGAAAKNPEQLTLFYNGQVLVYDDVPTDKAKAIMVLASSISSKTTCFAAAAAAAANAAPIKASLSQSPKSTAAAADKQPASTNDVQARKASISRFLEKRKDKFAKPALVEKDEVSKPGRDSRSPSPPASRSPVTPPRPASRCGLVDELKQQLEKCTGETAMKRSGGAGSGAATGANAGTAAAAARQWIGV